MYRISYIFLRYYIFVLHIALSKYVYIHIYEVTFRTKEIIRISVCRAIDPWNCRKKRQSQARCTRTCPIKITWIKIHRIVREFIILSRPFSLLKLRKGEKGEHASKSRQGLTASCGQICWINGGRQLGLRLVKSRASSFWIVSAASLTVIRARYWNVRTVKRGEGGNRFELNSRINLWYSSTLFSLLARNLVPSSYLKRKKCTRSSTINMTSSRRGRDRVLNGRVPLCVPFFFFSVARDN